MTKSYDSFKTVDTTSFKQKQKYQNKIIICIISLLVMSKYKDFREKKFLIGPLLGEVRFFRVVLGLRRMKKNFYIIFYNYGP